MKKKVREFYFDHILYAWRVRRKEKKLTLVIWKNKQIFYTKPLYWQSDIIVPETVYNIVKKLKEDEQESNKPR
jgi:hypothetical protein